jgi:hypothetical protein
MDLPGTRGTLRLSRLNDRESPAQGASYRSVYVPGPGYAGLEDNDIRGFLDGTFYLPWNQATQTHLRIGRFGYGGPGSAAPVGKAPMYGEHELFRVLQSWSDITLPPGSSVTDVRLSVGIEDGASVPVRVFAYAVHRPWNPGHGGIYRNNVSVAAPGEVWWNEAASDEEPWGLPGVGYAAADPRADTPEEPLADALCTPETERIEFRSDSLAQYVGRQVSSGAAIRFLIKLSDVQEDVPGVRVLAWSAETGDDGNPVLRPRLEIEWTVAEDRLLVEREIRLESGRALDLPVVECRPGERFAVCFRSAEGFEPPTLFVREERSSLWSDWREADAWFESRGDRLQVRLAACSHPVQLGRHFESSLREAFVLAGPPEEQEVLWDFVSPTGRSSRVSGTYGGDFRWNIRFLPDEVGSWTYRWKHALRHQDMGPEGRFDVLAWSLPPVESRLAELALDAERAAATGNISEVERLRVGFSRLQRAAMALLDPGEFAEAVEGTLGEALRVARSALWGRPMPQEIERKSMQRHTTWNGRELAEPFPRITVSVQPRRSAMGKGVRQRVRTLIDRMDSALRGANRGARQR